MQRRDFISGGLGVILGGLGTYFAVNRNKQTARSDLSAPAVNKGVRELTMVTTWPRDFPGLGTGAQRCADRISAATDGRLKINLHAGGELVPALQSFDAVSSGTADIMHGAPYYWQGKHTGLNFFAAVPFGFTANEISAWINFGGGQELWDEIYQQFNLKGFPAGNTGVQMGGWFRKEINSIEDIKGLKMRMPGLGGKVIDQLGGQSVTLAGGEIFAALQSGAIDATEWVGPYNDLAFGFYKVAKFYYYPGFHEPGTVLELSFNLDVWNSLSAADREIIRNVAAAEYLTTLDEFNANNAKSLRELINTHGVSLRRFPENVFNEFGRASEAVVADVANENDLAARVYNSYKTFRDDVASWTELSDQEYTNARTKFFAG